MDGHEIVVALLPPTKQFFMYLSKGAQRLILAVEMEVHTLHMPRNNLCTDRGGAPQPNIVGASLFRQQVFVAVAGDGIGHRVILQFTQNKIRGSGKELLLVVTSGKAPQKPKEGAHRHRSVPAPAIALVHGSY